jgi:hypothetical protein
VDGWTDLGLVTRRHRCIAKRAWPPSHVDQILTTRYFRKPELQAKGRLWRIWNRLELLALAPAAV